MPGVYDSLGARLAQISGFEGIFQTGFGTSASLFGLPDYGFIDANDTISNARRICAATLIPVLVDADTGYGNALSVWNLVKKLENAGAAGMFLEDQKWPKRCGHMAGKQVVPEEEYLEKLGAALDARSSKNFFIVSRTDSRISEGLNGAIERGIQNRKAGADAIFIEAPQSLDEMKQIGRSINAPLVANMIEGGRTPLSSANALTKIGFNIILYPLSILFANTQATISVLSELKKTGHSGKTPLVDFDQFNKIIDLPKFKKLETKYGKLNNKK